MGQERWKAQPGAWDWLEKGARRLMRGWAYKGAGKRPYVPNQLGCLENPRSNGGTLGVRSEPVENVNELRLSVVKTGGKFRPVTSQAAYVKRVLNPVNDSAYAYLSRKDWLVRGELTAEHLEPVARDLLPGEDYISGDYTAATDNLHLGAVQAVVGVLSEHLEGEEKDVLVRSFQEMKVVKGETVYPLRRGSMCGNLLSFVVLCIVNKVCHQEALRRAGENWERAVRINGDDIAFCGDGVLYKEWREVTSSVGLIVNEGKTGVSDHLIELNSRVYLVSKGRLVRKLNFGFLRPYPQHTDSLLEPVMQLCMLLRPSTVSWFLTNPVISGILSEREINPSLVPKRWWSFLVKRSWFRLRILEPPEVVTISGEERVIERVLGPPLKEEFASRPGVADAIGDLEDEYARQFVRENEGRKVRPVQQALLPRVHDRRGADWLIYRKRRPVYKRLWVKRVLDLILAQVPEALAFGTVYSPGLQDDLQPRLGLRIKLRYDLRGLFRPLVCGIKEWLPDLSAWVYQVGC